MDKVLVIGGGAAGMMAAITAARQGVKVTLLEQNEKLGKKLFITGKGRCNLTNASGRDTHLDAVVSNKRFLYSAESEFDAAGVMDFFTGLGLSLKTERGNRVFPASDHSSDVIKALEYELRRLGVEIRLHTKVEALMIRACEQTVHDTAAAENMTPEGAETERFSNRKPEKKAGNDRKGESGATGICTGVLLSDGKKLFADRVILATGGISYPSTGSDGSGFTMVKRAGHTVTKLYPALTGLVTAEGVSDLAGLSLRNIGITVKCKKKKVYEDFGELLFTHKGVSGPVILSASSFLTELLAGGQQAILSIDLKPALDAEKLDDRLLREIEIAGAKQVKTMMQTLLPKALISLVLAKAMIPETCKAAELTKKDRRRLLDTQKSLTFTVTGTEGFESAIITKGGIATREINPSTMESKLISGLYFAGECIDVDALTGGFNLQIAWSTGYLAGRGI